MLFYFYDRWHFVFAIENSLTGQIRPQPKDEIAGRSRQPVGFVTRRGSPKPSKCFAPHTYFTVIKFSDLM